MLQSLLHKPWVYFLLLLIMLYFPVFSHLDELPLDCWDEARLAMNAHDMNQTNNWIVTTYWNNPDMWNTKPPLMIWLQVLSIRLLGENELAIRFPSALAALGTCFLLFWFFAKKYGNALVGLLACVVLITSDGYVRRHGIRTGDYDSLLTMFTTSFILFWFLYLEKAKPKYFFLFTGALILASLTKGVQPLIFLPALVIYAVYRQKHLSLLKSGHLYAGILLFILLISGYYLLREHYNPGYINAVFENELGGRYTQALEGHKGSFWFYHDILSQADFKFWYIMVPFAIWLGVTAKNVFIKRLTIFISIAAFLYLIIISMAATKLNWYDMPALPLLSVVVAIGFDQAGKWIPHSAQHKKQLTLLVAITLILIPYKIIFEKTTGGEDPADMQDNRKIAGYFQQALKGGVDIKGYYIAQTYLDQNIDWYVRLLEERHIVKSSSPNHLEVSYKVIAFQYDVQQYIEQNYTYDFLGTPNEYIKVYRLKDRKTVINVLTAN
ncbi:MAG: glycosyltransferase family 39 protein [Sphingobacteriales bacterium]|nr:MAG: glycosyltransferase family 39 protein [Sphingobacteriales bacterium]